MEIFIKFYKYILDIFFPLSCIDCNRNIENNENGPICGYCFENIKISAYLGKNQPGLEIISVANYGEESIRKLIYAFKYDGIASIEATFRNLIKKYLQKVDFLKILDIENATAVPIPLYPKRMRKRGFNQAEKIAKILSENLNIEMRADIIRRIKDTEPQINLDNYKDRQANIEDCFSLIENNSENSKESIRGRDIIIVDDIYTSGSTINEAAKVLKKAGAKKILAFVLAKAA